MPEDSGGLQPQQGLCDNLPPLDIVAPAPAIRQFHRKDQVGREA
jgi:hypothetical protein